MEFWRLESNIEQHEYNIWKYTFCKLIGVWSYFSNFARFWYQMKAHIFVITHTTCQGQNMSSYEDISENVTSYGNQNYKLTQWGICDCTYRNDILNSKFTPLQW